MIKFSKSDHHGQIPVQFCESCGYTLDAATGCQGDNPPKSGDITVCLRCAELMVFNEDLTLRRANIDDLLELDEETSKDLDRIVQMTKSVRNIGDEKL